jgi:hypothetical protein
MPLADQRHSWGLELATGNASFIFMETDENLTTKHPRAGRDPLVGPASNPAAGSREMVRQFWLAAAACRIPWILPVDPTEAASEPPGERSLQLAAAIVLQAVAALTWRSYQPLCITRQRCPAPPTAVVTAAPAPRHRSRFVTLHPS